MSAHAGAGPADRRELAQEVGARHRGAGRLTTALQTALLRGEVERAGRGRYARARVAARPTRER